MEINSKQLLAIAAIGAVAWYMLRKGPGTPTGAVTPAAAPARPGGGIWDGFGVGADLYTALNQAPTTNQKAPVSAGEIVSTKPEPYTPPASGGGAVWGAGTGGATGFTGIKDGRRTYADGSSAALTSGELDLYNRGILGNSAGAYTGVKPPASTAGNGGADWGGSSGGR